MIDEKSEKVCLRVLRFCNICCILFIFYMIIEFIVRVDIYVIIKIKLLYYF